ncbi:MAG: hypothetical protein ACRYHA_20835 [Janthinobacterium lividum]
MYLNSTSTTAIYALRAAFAARQKPMDFPLSGNDCRRRRPAAMFDDWTSGGRRRKRGSGGFGLTAEGIGNALA